MNTALANHFAKIDKFNWYEIISEEDKWYLFNQTDSKKVKESISVAPKLEKNLIVLGDNKFGSLLVAFDIKNEDHIYSLNTNTMNLSPTELTITNLIKY